MAEYVKRMYHKNELRDISFWRDSTGNEVDLVVNEGLILSLSEFKSTQTVMPDLFKGFRYFEQHSRKDNLIKSLVYTGSVLQKRAEANIIPWDKFGGFSQP